MVSLVTPAKGPLYDSVSERNAGRHSVSAHGVQYVCAGRVATRSTSEYNQSDHRQAALVRGSYHSKAHL